MVVHCEWSVLLLDASQRARLADMSHAPEVEYWCVESQSDEQTSEPGLDQENIVGGRNVVRRLKSWI